MNSNLLKYLIFTFLAFLLGCQKEEKSVSDLIAGKWEWVRSVSPWTGHVSDPQTTGMSMTLEFTDNGLMKEYRNDTLSYSTSYSIELNQTEPIITMLVFNSGIRSQFYFVKDSLIINAAYVDGPVSTYLRL